MIGPLSALSGIGTTIVGIGEAIAAFASLLTGPVIAAILAIIGTIYFMYKAFFDTNSALYKFMENNKIFAIIIKTLMGPVFGLVGLITDISRGTLTWGKAFDYLGGILQGLSGPFGVVIGAIRAMIMIFTQKNSPALYEMPEHLAAGFTKFANVITSLAVPALNMFLAPLKLFGSIMSGVWSGIGTIVSATSQLFGKDNVVGIKATFDAVETLATTTAKITPDNMMNVKQLTAEVQKFNTELQIMAVVTASEPLMNLVKAIKGQINAMTDGTKDKTIILKVGEREFGKIVLDTINKKGNIDTAVKSTSTVT